MTEAPEIKHFDPAVLASVSTGTLLVAPFGLMHEAAEHVLGHPIWTHQFPALHGKLRDAILAQFPDMPVQIGEAGWEATRDAVRERYGASVEVKRGSGEGAISPLDPEGFPEGFEPSAVIVGEA